MARQVTTQEISSANHLNAKEKSVVHQVSRRRRVAFKASVALAAVAALSLSACGGGTDSAGSAGEAAGSSAPADAGATAAASAVPATFDCDITYQTYQGPDIVEAWDKQWQDLESNTGISVTTETVPQAEQSQRLLASAAGGALPDVAMISAQWFKILAEKGLLEPLDQSMFSEVSIDDMHPALRDAYTFDGQLYGLPTDLDMGVLFYNKDLFAKAGLPEPTQDWTWDDLATAAKSLTSGDGTGKQFGVDIAAAWGNYPFLAAVANSYGGSLIDTASGTPSMETDAGRKAIELWNRLVVQDQSAPGFGSDASIVNGNIGMGIYGPWAAYYFLKDAKFDWGVTTLPKGSQPATWGWGSVLVAFKDSDQKECALKFMDNFMSKGLVEQRAADWSWTPPLQSVLSDPAFVSSTALNLDADQKALLLSAIPSAQTPPLVNEQVAVAKALDEQLSALQAGDATVDEVVANLDESWKPLVSAG